MTHSEIAFDCIAAGIGQIPPGPFAVGGPVNGARTEFIWSPADWAKFGQAYHIRYNTTGALHTGNAIDVENGDATPANIEPWIVSCRSSLDPLLVYCNRSNLDACVAARDAAHKASGRYAFIWCATLDGTITSRAMNQFGQIAGGAVDVSLITDTRLIAAMAARAGDQ